jgi:hypothetical protein
MTQMTCTYEGCREEATRIMAVMASAVHCYYVAPYCDEHAQGITEEGGLPASGPALSTEAQKIGGIR